MHTYDGEQWLQTAVVPQEIAPQSCEAVTLDRHILQRTALVSAARRKEDKGALSHFAHDGFRPTTPQQVKMIEPQDMTQPELMNLLLHEHSSIGVLGEPAEPKDSTLLLCYLVGALWVFMCG